MKDVKGVLMKLFLQCSLRFIIVIRPILFVSGAMCSVTFALVNLHLICDSISCCCQVKTQKTCGGCPQVFFFLFVFANQAGGTNPSSFH